MVWVVQDTNVIVRRVFIKHGVFEDKTFFSNQGAWNEIFYHIFGQWPSGLNDPLWEMLFDATDGYAMLRVASTFVT
jgi:hypothetical protein